LRRDSLSLCTLLLCSVISSCTAGLREGDSRPALSFQVSIDRAGSPAHAAHEANPLTHIWLIPVTRGVFGPPVGKSFVEVYAHDGERFQISQRTLESGLAAGAKASKPFLVRYDPVETRIARLGTATMKSDPSTSGQSGLRDPASGRTLILIYVDRACLIRGPNINVAIPGAGLHWLELLDSPAHAGAPAARPPAFELRGTPTQVIFKVTETRIP